MSTYITLEEEARLALEGAEAELAHAQGALQDFIFTNCFVLDGRPILTGPPAKREELETELRELQVSHESAVRKLQAAQEVYSELKAERG